MFTDTRMQKISYKHLDFALYCMNKLGYFRDFFSLVQPVLSVCIVVCTLPDILNSNWSLKATPTLCFAQDMWLKPLGTLCPEPAILQPLHVHVQLKLHHYDGSF